MKPRVKSGPIKNLRKLLETLDITREELREVLLMPAVERFCKDESLAKKKDGSARVVYKPHPLVRKIQGRINSRILAKDGIIEWPHYLYGSIPKVSLNDIKDSRDYIAAAQVHCEAKSLLTIDIKDFFDNVNYNHVYSIFHTLFKYSRAVSSCLANICCYENHLVQGALTSSFIANLIFFDVEHDLIRRLQNKGLRYTRLIDDINISSKISNYDFDYAYQTTNDMLLKKELPINNNKTKKQFVSTKPISVHGLRVGFKTPRLPSDEVKRIKAAVFDLELTSQETFCRTGPAYRKSFNRILGRVNKLQRVKHKDNPKLKKRLLKLLPMPNHDDFLSLSKLIIRLNRDHEKHAGSYYYRKRYYLAQEKINLLQRSKAYIEITASMRSRLKLIKPKDND